MFSCGVCIEAVSPWHYLLGHSFQLITDHAPFQWLSAQKMEGMLCCCALAIPEYDFQIVYHKGTLNANADGLSWCNRSDTHSCAVTSAIPHTARDELCHTQQTDSHWVIKAYCTRRNIRTSHCPYPSGQSMEAGILSQS